MLRLQAAYYLSYAQAGQALPNGAYTCADVCQLCVQSFMTQKMSRSRQMQTITWHALTVFICDACCQSRQHFEH